jgi:hypothetical protein
MASVKLTNAMRVQTQSNATKGAFEAEKLAQKKKLNDLSLRIYDVLVPKTVQKALSQLPKDFCYSNNGCSIILGQSERVNFRAQLNFGKSMQLPITAQYGYDDPIVAPELYKEWLEMKAAEKQLDADGEALQDKIRAVLYSATTVSKLLVMWPEAKAYLPHEAFAYAGNLLPAVIVVGLNEAIAKATGKPVLKAA